MIVPIDWGVEPATRQDQTRMESMWGYMASNRVGIYYKLSTSHDLYDESNGGVQARLGILHQQHWDFT